MEIVTFVLAGLISLMVSGITTLTIHAWQRNAEANLRWRSEMMGKVSESTQELLRVSEHLQIVPRYRCGEGHDGAIALAFEQYIKWSDQLDEVEIELTVAAMGLLDQKLHFRVGNLLHASLRLREELPGVKSYLNGYVDPEEHLDDVFEKGQDIGICAMFVMARVEEISAGATTTPPPEWELALAKEKYAITAGMNPRQVFERFGD